MKISVVIPAFNEAQKLAACLDALMAQTVLPHEILVVDNNSADGTAAVAATYDSVRVLSEKQQGRVFARNAGFDAATGDIIARIDADSVVPPDWLAWIAHFYEQPNHKQLALTGGARFYNMRLNRFVSWAYAFLVFRFNVLLMGSPTLWGSNMAITKAQWHAVKDEICLRNDIHEDLDISIHLRQIGTQISYDSSKRVRVEMRRIHTDRQSLWPYLQMWPRTLRTHGFWSWPICWLVGALGLYAASPLPLVLEKAAQALGKKPLHD